MKRESGKWVGVAVLALLISLAAGGCSKKDQKLDAQIQAQIALVDREVKALEQNQAAMRGMIKEMQAQLNAMQAELDKEAPRVIAANGALASLRQLTTEGFGESAAHWTLRNPSYNVLWIGLFLLLLWFFYRMRARSHAKE